MPEGLQYVTTETTTRKVLIDGQIYILQGDKVYNIMGVQIR